MDAHRRLPRILRVWSVVPLTVVLAFILGATFTLPPGPLCDEGMVLFMEGGCDFARSNEFFFAKLGLLLAMNLVFIAARRHRITEWRGFLPHFGVLAVLTIVHYSDEDCRDYYSHPNGSIGQMTAEAMAFGALLGSVLKAKRPVVVLLVCNLLHVGVFYLALLVTNHWTWGHTFAIVSALAAAVLFVDTGSSHSREEVVTVCAESLQHP